MAITVDTQVLDLDKVQNHLRAIAANYDGKFSGLVAVDFFGEEAYQTNIPTLPAPEFGNLLNLGLVAKAPISPVEVVHPDQYPRRGCACRYWFGLTGQGRAIAFDS